MIASLLASELAVETSTLRADKTAARAMIRLRGFAQRHAVWSAMVSLWRCPADDMAQSVSQCDFDLLPERNVIALSRASINRSQFKCLNSETPDDTRAQIRPLFRAHRKREFSELTKLASIVC